jgi:hypothetical protein
VARAALLAYLLLIVYASWFPFSGWRSTGLPPLAFLNLQPQRYWTGFDVMVNVVGYMPLGGLLVLSLYPRVRGVWAVLVAALGGVLVSGIDGNRAELPAQPRALEPRPVHQFGRRLAGAIIGPCSPMPARPEPPVPAARRWFAPHASQGLVLLALWPLAQVYPQGYLFGNGQVLPMLSEWLSDWLDSDIDLVPCCARRRR